jgi:hypothetical protein
MAFSEWAQNIEVSLNSVWFSDEAHFYLDDMVNKKMCNVGHHLKLWTANANFL